MNKRIIDKSEITDQYLEQLAITAPMTAVSMRICRDNYPHIVLYEISLADDSFEMSDFVGVPQ